jgi:hypothetical protein
MAEQTTVLPPSMLAMPGPEETHPTVCVKVMSKLMRGGKYAVRAYHLSGNRYRTLAEPVNADGSDRQGPVYEWDAFRNCWAFYRYCTSSVA